MTRKNFAQTLWNHLTNNTDTEASTFGWLFQIGNGPYCGGAHMYADKLKHSRVARIKTMEDFDTRVIAEVLNNLGVHDVVVAKWRTSGYCYRNCLVYAIYTKGDYVWNLCK